MKDVDSNTDLVSRNYATGQALDERIRILRAFSGRDLVPWSLGLIQPRGDELVLDAGCGTGNFLLPYSRAIPDGVVTGVDLSDGVLRELGDKVADRPNIRLERADVEDLPFPADSFDIVMANFMLQHVRDIVRALCEFRRVLRPKGRLMLVTGSVRSKGEIYKLHSQAVSEVWPEHPDEERGMTRFSLENGPEMVRGVMDNVVVTVAEDTLQFPSVDGFMTYYRNSVWGHSMKGATESIRNAVLARVKQAAVGLFETSGQFTTNAINGALIASKRI